MPFVSSDTSCSSSNDSGHYFSSLSVVLDEATPNCISIRHDEERTQSALDVQMRRQYLFLPRRSEPLRSLSSAWSERGINRLDTYRNHFDNSSQETSREATGGHPDLRGISSWSPGSTNSRVYLQENEDELVRSSWARNVAHEWKSKWRRSSSQSIDEEIFEKGSLDGIQRNRKKPVIIPFKKRRLSRIKNDPAVRRRREWLHRVLGDSTPPEGDVTGVDVRGTKPKGDRDFPDWRSGWDKRRIALRTNLVTRGKSVQTMNLLEANQTEEAIDVAMEMHCQTTLDVCLMWCCLLNDVTKVRELLSNGANVKARDADGFTPLHVAVEVCSMELVKVVLAAGANVNAVAVWDMYPEVTPLMLATYGNSPLLINVLVEAGAKVDFALHSSTKHTPLYHAIRAEAIDSVRCLLALGATLNLTELYSETPLHTASIQGSEEVVRLLLSAGADVRAVCGTARISALHFAAREEYSHIVLQLLQAGAETNQRTFFGSTPLHLAAKSQSAETIEILLKFKADPNAKDKDGKSPLHCCISKGSRSIECIQLLLDAGADPNAADNSGYTPVHLSALYESTSLVKLFLRNGGDVSARTLGGTSVLNVIMRRTPTVISQIQENLDRSISLMDHDRNERDLQVQLDFRVLMPNKSSIGPECNLLSCFIQEGQKMLLSHPLCEVFIYLKWLRARHFFIVNLIYYSLLISLLSVYIMIVFPTSTMCHLKTNNSHELHSENVFGNSTEDTVTLLEECKLEKLKPLLANLLYIIWILLFFLVTKELFQIVDSPKTYLSSMENVLIWPVIILTIIITCTSYLRKDTEPWEHHLASVVILCSWIEMLMLIGRFPIFGLYIQMLTQVAKNFGKFLLAYSCLLNAFSLSFGVLFPNHAPFSSYGLRLIKTLVMMTGELEYNAWFYSEQEAILYKSTSYLIFFVFLICVTIILMNLLVGLAVSDIQGLQRSAGLDRLVRQTVLISHFEGFMFSQWLVFLIPQRALAFFHNKMLLLPSIHGSSVICLTPKIIRETGLPQDLVDVVYRSAHSRQRTSHKQAVSRFLALSNAAKYSAEGNSVEKGMEALRCGIDLLVADVEDRRKESSSLNEMIVSFSTQMSSLQNVLSQVVIRDKKDNNHFNESLKDNNRRKSF